MNLNKIVFEKYLEENQKTWLSIMGDHRALSKISELRKNFNKLMSNENAYKSFDIQSGEVLKIIFAHNDSSGMTKDCIICDFFYFSDEICTKKNIQQEIFSIRSFYKKPTFNIWIRVLAQRKKMLQALHLLKIKAFGVNLTGDVLTSLNKTETLRRPEWKNYQVEVMKSDDDLKKVLAMQLKAHRCEPTSIVNSFNLTTYRKQMRALFQKMIADRSVFLLKKKNTIVGVIAIIMLQKNRKAHVATIAIHPDHQGKGLSQLLYLNAFQEMKKESFFDILDLLQQTKF